VIGHDAMAHVLRAGSLDSPYECWERQHFVVE
jgi:hypothetical protein